MLFNNKTLIFLIALFLICASVLGFIYQYTNTNAVKKSRNLEVVSSIEEFKTRENTDDFMLYINRETNDYDVIISNLTLTREYMLNIKCERVHASTKFVLCAGRQVSDEQAITLFDTEGKELFSMPFDGIVSRARVAKDSRYGAVTTFVAGDSYASAQAFSTRTYIFDLINKSQLGTLEDFTLIQNGNVISSIDRNYWGVTFFEDSNKFLATVMFGNIPYLVKGDIAKKTMEVIASEVECPSISPDNTRIVYKKRQPDATWRLYGMKLDTLEPYSLAETQNVDDQVEWLDNSIVLYGKSQGESMNVMQNLADGDGTTQLFLNNAFSPVVVK